MGLKKQKKNTVIVRNSVKLLIFDFDGTLADTKKIWHSSILKTLRKERIYCPECETKIILHFGKKIGDVLQTIEMGAREAIEIANAVYMVYSKSISKIRFQKNIEVIKNMKAKKYIVSNSITKLIKLTLKNKINMFNGIYGGDKFTNKADVILRLMKKHNAKPVETMYIGDRVGDIKLAHKLRIKSVIISNKISWNSRKELLGANPDFIISDLKQLTDIIDIVN